METLDKRIAQIIAEESPLLSYLPSFVPPREPKWWQFWGRAQYKRDYAAWLAKNPLPTRIYGMADGALGGGYGLGTVRFSGVGGKAEELPSAPTPPGV